jgi:hypothetical protein
MTTFRMAVLGFAAAAMVAGSHAQAAGTDMRLAPGKPAGVQDAQRHHHRNMLLIGGVAALVVAGVVVAAVNSGSATCSAANCPNSVSTSSTS